MRIVSASRRRIALVTACLIAVAAFPAIAQQHADDTAAMVPELTTYAPALAEIQADKAGFIAQILSGLTDSPSDGGAELEEMLMALDASDLLAASGASTRAELVEAAFGIAPSDLGDPNADLVFTPVTPCRLFNTLVTGTPLSGGTTTTFGVNGTPGVAGDLSAQGGDASDCGVGSDPAAVMVTLTYVNPTAGGNLRAFAYGGAVPLASSINFGTSPAALGNTTIIPVCVGCGTGLDIDIFADLTGGNTVHVVGDVVGIFNPPANLGTHVSVAGVGFHHEENGGSCTYSQGSFDMRYEAGSNCDAFAPIHIPDGRTVTRLDCRVLDNVATAGAVLSVELRRVDLTTGSSSSVLATPNSVDSGSVQLISDTTATNGTIDNGGFAYFLWADFGSAAASTSLQLDGCRVAYN